MSKLIKALQNDELLSCLVTLVGVFFVLSVCL